MKRWLVAGLLAALAVGGGWWGWSRWRARNAAAPYRTARVDRGDIVQTVRATGVVQPLQVVQVGTQVNGPILKLYADYNSRVKAGDVVAQIDPAVYEARLAQDEATLRQSLAAVDQAVARLGQAERELGRAQELAKRDLIAQSDLDAALAGRDVLAAEVKVAQARVAQSEAALRMSRANLNYTTIRAPVDGIVVSRAVNEGQTVVASLSAQTMFVIATDLSRVQVEASIAEADIGSIRAGQPVIFSVDAYDQEAFTGAVQQVRLAASTVQNVVTYPVVVEAENPGEKLFPSMTANLSCEVARRMQALRVPNAALRFRPDPEPAQTGPERPGRAPAAAAAREGRRVWIPTDASPRAVPVETGITDGSFTEITGGELREGQEILTGLQAAAPEGPSGVVNPFAPRMPGGRRGMR
jgi:HlyD family secretion protein